QYLVGAFVSVWVGSCGGNMASGLHIFLAVVLAALAAAVWAAIAGFLKATVGVHEVISTIMLNWIAIWIPQALVGQDRQVGAGVERHRREGTPARVLGRPGPPGAAHRVLHRTGGAGRLLAAPQPD